MDLLTLPAARRPARRRWLGQLLALAATPAFGAPPASRPGKQDALALVARAVAYYRKHGRAKAFAEFNQRGGAFFDRGMYIFVYDMNGVCLAIGNNPRMIGKSLRELRDANGNHMIKRMLEIAARSGRGWNEYVWINPATTRAEEKMSYFEKVDDVVIGAGVYK